MQEFAEILSNFGFPIAVASYLLFRLEGKMDSLEKSNARLADEIKTLNTTVTNKL